MSSILQLGPLPAAALWRLGEAFTLVADPGAADDAALAGIGGIATNGKTRLDAALLARLPALSIVACLGAGTDGLDLGALQRRGVRVTTTSQVLADDVADVAMGLVLSLARDFRRADRFVRAGEWAGGKYRLGASLAGMQLGVLGLGSIGMAVARRAAACGMVVGYHNRRPRPGAPQRYFDSLAELAAWSRMLVVCCPGGAATRHLVDAGVLEALGAEGWLVNVARGSIVDEAALVAALAEGRIAGAGLDVYEGEPAPRADLLGFETTLVLPHVGSATVETRDAMACSMVQSLLQALGPERT